MQDKVDPHPPTPVETQALHQDRILDYMQGRIQAHTSGTNKKKSLLEKNNAPCLWSPLKDRE